MKTKVYKRLSALFALFALLLSFLLGDVLVRSTAKADTILKYDSRAIEEDLSDLGIDREEYVVLSGTRPEPVSFMEYCYFENAYLAQGYYGLYVYVYNPSGNPVKGSGNVVEMATKYDADGNILSYDHIPLRLLDLTDDNLLVKFKVEGAYEKFYTLAKAYSKKTGERRYDVVGVQFASEVSSAMDTSFSNTFYFSGYSAGCGSDTSTLKCRSTNLETLNLKVHQTYYRSEQESAPWVYKQINTAYFSVPNRAFNEYGDKLQKIKAGWYEYKTKPMFVTSDQSAYDTLLDWRYGALAPADGDDYRVLWERWVGEYDPVLNEVPLWYEFEKWYSCRSTATRVNDNVHSDRWEDAEYLRDLHWLFKVEGGEDKLSWSVSDDEIKAYSAEYNSYIEDYMSEHNDFIQGAEGEYLRCLFSDYLDEYRAGILYTDVLGTTPGYRCEEIDAGTSNQIYFNRYDNLFDKLFGVETSYSETFYPIVKITPKDVSGVTAAEFARNNYINSADASEVYTYCVQELALGRTPVLFRFAIRPYYAAGAVFDKCGDGDWSHEYNGYVAQETVFLNFDVISLTFRDDSGSDTVIGVVADPIDIVPGLEAPSEGVDDDEGMTWLRKIIAAILLILALYFFGGPLLSLLIKFVTGLISLLSKGIKTLLDKIFHRRE